MRALRTCDFCTAEAVGTFEIVPPELEPSEAKQRRVVLCDDCETQLSTLHEPLLARAGAERSAANDGANASGDGPDESPSNSTTESTREDRTRDPGATLGAGGAAASEVAATDSADGVALERDRTVQTTGDESPDVPPADESPSDEPAAGEEAAENRASDDRAESNPAPPAYGKVVRLLRNRTFPIERRAVESLAAGAYDLESREVEAILKHAIEEGEFAESDGELRRP